jgi:hypothetical protein
LAVAGIIVVSFIRPWKGASSRGRAFSLGAERCFPRLGQQKKTKKAGVVEYPEVFHHVGLLVDESPGVAGLLFIQSSNSFSL